MDTDDITSMAYACIWSANEITDILKIEFGVACGKFKTEDEYLKGILKHVKVIEKNTEDYLNGWNLLDDIDIKDFRKKIKQLRKQIEMTIETPLTARG